MDYTRALEEYLELFTSRNGTNIPVSIVANLLTDTFTLSYSSISIQMIQYYYSYTSKKTVKDKGFIHDPIEQCHWCEENVPYFSSLAKDLRLMRNKIMHKGNIPFDILRRIIFLTLEFSKKPESNATFTNVLIQKLVEICRIVNLNTLQRRDQKSTNIIVNSEQNSLTEDFETLSYYKVHPVHRIRLKGHLIRIKSGKYTNCTARLLSWCGTKVRILILEGESKDRSISLSVSTRIEIIE